MLSVISFNLCSPLSFKVTILSLQLIDIKYALLDFYANIRK